MDVMQRRTERYRTNPSHAHQGGSVDYCRSRPPGSAARLAACHESVSLRLARGRPTAAASLLLGYPTARGTRS
eukprot:3082635-Pyramimonas_sp.AAC.1